MPSKLNLYFDPQTARCVEAAFAAYVAMICYDTEKGGIVPGCKGSRFSYIVDRLGYHELAISRWDFDAIQNEMLSEIQNNKNLMVKEQDLQAILNTGKRPWFVMQNKGDMMTSAAFMYNYIAFFADPRTNAAILNAAIPNEDPFFINVLIRNTDFLEDPLRPVGIKVEERQPEPGRACFVVAEIQKLVDRLNPAVKFSCEEINTKNIVTVSVGSMVSKSDGVFPLLRAPYHYEQSIEFLGREPSDIKATSYTTQFNLIPTKNLADQFVQLRLLNAHLGWNELGTAMMKSSCDEESFYNENTMQFLQGFMDPKDFEDTEKTTIGQENRKQFYLGLCENTIGKLNADITKEDARAQCSQAYKRAMVNTCKNKPDVFPFHPPFSVVYNNRAIAVPGVQQQWTIDFNEEDENIGSNYPEAQFDITLNTIVNNNPIACKKLLKKITTKNISYSTLEYNSLFMKINGKSFYDRLVE